MPEARVFVDFNDVGDDGRLGALAKNADNLWALRVGAPVRLYDEEGNTAQGLIAEVADRGLLWIALRRDTWRSRPAPAPAPQVIAAYLDHLVESCVLAPDRASIADCFTQSVAPSGIAPTGARPSLGLPQPLVAVPSSP